MNKNTNLLLDTNDTLEIGTDDFDKVTGSDCGGNSYCDKGSIQRTRTTYKFLYSVFFNTLKIYTQWRLFSK